MAHDRLCAGGRACDINQQARGASIRSKEASQHASCSPLLPPFPGGYMVSYRAFALRRASSWRESTNAPASKDPPILQLFSSQAFLCNAMPRRPTPSKRRWLRAPRPTRTEPHHHKRLQVTVSVPRRPPRRRSAQQVASNHSGHCMTATPSANCLKDGGLVHHCLLELELVQGRRSQSIPVPRGLPRRHFQKPLPSLQRRDGCAKHSRKLVPRLGHVQARRGRALLGTSPVSPPSSSKVTFTCSAHQLGRNLPPTPARAQHARG